MALPADDLGNFIVTGVLPGTFRIVVEFIGYSAFTINNVVINQKHEVADLKTIRLLKFGTLQNVVVTAQKKLVENRISETCL